MSADKNMTGEQIQQIMDMFLFKALEPLILYTNVFDAQVEYLLLLIATNRKRKLSSLDREVVVEKLAAFLSVSDRHQKYALIRDTRIERSFIHRFLRAFVKDTEGYVKDYNQFMSNPTRAQQVKFDKYAAETGRCSRHEMYKAVQICAPYLKKFYEYRNEVIGHYIKNNNKLAKAHTTNPGSNSSCRDLVQSIHRSVITALDKYDSRKGALTSYIGTWAKNATTTTKEHEYGIAYTVPQTQRKKMYEGTSTDVNFSTSLDAVYGGDDEDGEMGLHAVIADSAPMEKDLEKDQQIHLVQKLAKKVDPLGLARLSLDIGEYFAPTEHSIMLDHMREEGLA